MGQQCAEQPCAPLLKSAHYPGAIRISFVIIKEMILGHIMQVHDMIKRD